MGKRRRDWIASQVGRRKTVLQLDDNKNFEDSPPISPKRFQTWSPPRPVRPDHPTKESRLAGDRSMDAEVAEFLKEISALSTSEEAENAAVNADSEDLEVAKETKVDENEHESSVESNIQTELTGIDTSMWQECWDEKMHAHYYWNVGTNEVSWHPPPGFIRPEILAANASGKMDTDEDDVEEKVELITFYGPPSPEAPRKRKKKPKVIGPQLPPNMLKEQNSLDPHSCEEVVEPIIYGPHLPIGKSEKSLVTESSKYGPPLPPSMEPTPDLDCHIDKKEIDKKVVKKERSKKEIDRKEINKKEIDKKIEREVLADLDSTLSQKDLLKQLKLEVVPEIFKSKKSKTSSFVKEERCISRDSPLSEGQCSKSSEDEQILSHHSFTGFETPPVFSSPVHRKSSINNFSIESSVIKKKRKDDKEKKYRHHKEHKRKHSREDSDRKHHHKEKHRKHHESSVSSASSVSSSEDLQKLRRSKENHKKASKHVSVEINSKKIEHPKIPPPSVQILSTRYYEDEDSGSEKLKKSPGFKLDPETLLKKDVKQFDVSIKNDSSKKHTVCFVKSSEKLEPPLIEVEDDIMEIQKPPEILIEDIPEEPIDYEEIDRELEMALEKKLKRLDDKVDRKSRALQKAVKSAIQEKKDVKVKSILKHSEKPKSKDEPAVPGDHSVQVKKQSDEKPAKMPPPKANNSSNSTSPVASSLPSEAIEEMARTICEKLEFLDVSRKTISKLHILILELETRVMDYHAGALEKCYFVSKLQEAANQLHQFENSAVPEGWSCHWDRDFKRYFYSNGITGQTQWDYPEEKPVTPTVVSVKVIVPPPITEIKKSREKRNIKAEPKKSRPIPSSISLHRITVSSEPPPPGVDDDLPPPLPASEPPPPPPPVHPQTVDLEEGEIEDVEMELEDSSHNDFPPDSELGLVIAKPPQPAAANYYLYGDTNCIATSGIGVFPTHPPVPIGGFSSPTLAYSNYPAILPHNVAIYPQHAVVIPNPNPPPPVAPPVEISPPTTQPEVQTNGTKTEEMKSIKKEKKFKKKKISLSLKKKNLSSLVEKWQQIKEEVARISESESEEEQPSTFEDWKRQQIESGEALDNANFEEIGDWRARLLKSKSNKT